MGPKQALKMKLKRTTVRQQWRIAWGSSKEKISCSEWYIQRRSKSWSNTFASMIVLMLLVIILKDIVSSQVVQANNEVAQCETQYDTQQTIMYAIGKPHIGRIEGNSNTIVNARNCNQDVLIATVSKDEHGRDTSDLDGNSSTTDTQIIVTYKMIYKLRYFSRKNMMYNQNAVMVFVLADEHGRDTSDANGSTKICLCLQGKTRSILYCSNLDYEGRLRINSTRAKTTATKENEHSNYVGVRREEWRQPWFASMDELGSFLCLDFLFLVVALVNIGMIYTIAGRIDDVVLIVCIYDLAFTDAQLSILIFDILFR